MQIKTVSYTSRARLDLTEDDLADIHRSARHFNSLDAITGLLIFDGVRFLQFIEGPDEAIDDLVERLRRDPRHLAFEVRDERLVAARSFPDWSMELVRVSPGFSDARTALAAVLPQQISPEVRLLALKMADQVSAAP